MKRLTWMLGALFAVGIATAFAQPPGGRGGQGLGNVGGPGGGSRAGRLPPPIPIIEALDVDRDHVISSDELKNATKRLLTLDKNDDGQLSESEFGISARGPGRNGGQDGQPGSSRGGGRDGRRPPSEDEARPRGPIGRGPARESEDGPGGPMPPPSPDRMVQHAMEFDSDSDGKLSPDELLSFAKEFQNHASRRISSRENDNTDRGRQPARPQRPD